MAGRRREIEADGTRVAFVHLATEDEAKPHFEKVGLGDVKRFSDPDRRLYAAFGLTHGSLLQLFGPLVLARGAAALLVHGVGAPVGDPLQMPGVFLVRDGNVLKAFRHATIADRPDYTSLAACPVDRG